MAELLVRVIDSVLTGDPTSDASVSRRGDVISVCPDGWGWGDQEKTQPFWRIFKIPSLFEDPAEAFVAPEVPSDPNLPPVSGKAMRFRMNAFDLDNPLLDSVRGYINDDTRAEPAVMLDLDAMALLLRKP